MIFVFLHGKGADRTAYEEQMKQLSADYISFNAPFEHPTKQDKFLWYNKLEYNNHQEAVVTEYLYSLNYITKNLQTLNTPLSDIVIIGHSQGGGMAVATALELNLKAAISICGDLPYNVEYKNRSNTPIYWFEGELDTYINQTRKDSHQILKALNTNLDYQIIRNCTHTEIAPAFAKIREMFS